MNKLINFQVLLTVGEGEVAQEKNGSVLAHSWFKVIEIIFSLTDFCLLFEKNNAI